MLNNKTSFQDFGLNKNILSALHDMGYKKPSPIQSACIPYLMSGRDVLGMAQTGSGKTAAFSLPFLNKINPFVKFTQLLILAPTRELAIQVANVISKFSKYINGINILAIYGGQRYDIQIKKLRKGAHIIISTPGRLLDHLKKGTVNLINVRYLVLDEGDEMLKMGFIEDVKVIIQTIPPGFQTALFSATIPKEIKCISNKLMHKPKIIYIKSSGEMQPDIKQSYCLIFGKKIDALMKFLEIESFEAAIIFVKTKSSTVEISRCLEQNGYNSAALNGDMTQNIREKTLERLKNGHLDILISTDVASRGLDVDRISLVINYDIPSNFESYIHRIGRTGRAGKSGKAVLFIERRERYFLRSVQKLSRRALLKVHLPNVESLMKLRQVKFIKRIHDQLKSNKFMQYKLLIEEILLKEKLDLKTLSVALLLLAKGNKELVFQRQIKQH